MYQFRITALLTFAVLIMATPAMADDAQHPKMQWVKRHPLPSATNAPRLGYEASYGYDPQTRLLIRYGGHNQGGGGEQNSEVWTYDLDRDAWKHHEPNDAPPGVCCAQINVFHTRLRKFVRFPAFSGGHGWQSPREISLKNSSVWTYDLDTNTWTAMRPAPEIMPSPLRGAAYDPASDLIVLHGGEGSQHGTIAYDLQTNSWHKLNSKGGPSASLSQPGFTYDQANSVFVLFGSQFSDDPKTYLYDLKQNAWRVLETETHPPADRTSPVLAADTRNGVVLCLVRSSEKGENVPLETWALDVKEEKWKKLDVAPPDASGSRSRLLVYLADRNLFVLENNTKGEKEREQQIWTFRYADTPARTPALPEVRQIPDHLKNVIAANTPPLPTRLDATVIGPRAVELNWSELAGATRYVVERAPVAVYSNQEATRVAQRYADASEIAVGAIRAIGAFKVLTEQPIRTTHYFDDTVDITDGQQKVAEPHLAGRELKGEQLNDSARPYRYATYAYRIRSVDQNGIVGGPSPLVFTWPAAVQNLRAKEEGKTATRLKWDPSPGRAAKGYLVYRQDGQYNKTPIVRLTPKPISETEFLDESAGTSTRRYEVIAVDALGQEGEPTTPVWGRRQWAEFYKPYVGEWHQ